MLPLIFKKNIIGVTILFRYSNGIKIILLFLVIINLFVFNINALSDLELYNESVTNETSQNLENLDSTNTNSEEEEKILWLQGFEEIEEEKLLQYIEDKDKELISVTQNTLTQNVYFIFENNEKYFIKDEDNKMTSLLTLYGIECEKISMLETLSEIEKAEDKVKQDNFFSNAFLVLFLIGGIVLTVYMISKKKNTKQMVVINSSNSSSSKEDKEIPTVKFRDVEGIEELKADVMRIVDCFKNPEKYEKMGARIPKGIILYGPPGTGKTLIAKAIAGEAGVPFYSMVGSDFVEKYVGVGASRVRDLYKKARRSAPCIVFIDEIDAVAGQRGRDENSERDQTINALLAELDGFKGSENIVTICATNRLDMLDSAFKRAGRFDLKLAVGLPDKKGRKNILKIHGKNKIFSKEVDLDVIAVKTAGFSGAELESLLNESALIAVGKNKDEIDYEDIDDAFFKIIMQGNKKRRDIVTETNRVVAWHEAGHTLATKLLTDDSVSSVTIIGSSSGAGGVTFRNPKEDNILHSKEYLENSIKVMYAGRAAEEIYFKNKDSITTGASQDIKQATSILKEYLGMYGMGSLGMIDLSQFRQDYQDIVLEASELSKLLYDSVLSILLDNYEILKRLAETLLEKETLVEKEIDKIICVT